MSDVLTSAVSALAEKIGDGFDGSVRFDSDDEGSIVVDENGVREGTEDTAVTLGADAETFQAILEGDLDASAAFMSGRLRVDGDMGMAMKLGQALS